MIIYKTYGGIFIKYLVLLILQEKNQKNIAIKKTR